LPSSTVSPDQENVLMRDHAEVAMACFARMHEIGRRAGGGKRASDLHADMAALAHAGDDHPSATGADGGNGLCEAVDEVAFERRFEQTQALDFEMYGAGGR
jgi:hypothetical protein